MKDENEIIIVTTEGCYGCSIMKKLVDKTTKVFKTLYNEDIKVEHYDVKNVPDFINVNLKLEDFPTTIFIKNKVIKQIVKGTITVNEIHKHIGDLIYEGNK